MKTYLIKLIYDYEGLEESGIITYNNYDEANKVFNDTIDKTINLMESKTKSSYNPYKKIIMYEGTTVIKRWINTDEYKRFKNKRYSQN